MNRKIFILLLALSLFGVKSSFAQGTCTPGGGVTCTPNLNLWLPPFNYPNWNTPTNANFSAIDTAWANTAKTNASSTVFSGTVTASVLNGLINATQESGADGGTKLAACVAAAVAAGGGTCDARGFGATTQSVSSTVTLGCTTPTTCNVPVTVLFDPATVWVPLTSTTNMFVQPPATTVTGLTVDVTSVSGYSGKAYSFSGFNYAQQTTPSRLYSTILQHAMFHGFGNTTGTALYFAASGTSTLTMTPIQFVKLQDIHVQGFLYARYMTASGSNTYAWINGNVTENFKIEASVHGDYWVAGSGADTANISGNMCFQCSYEAGNAAEGVANVIDAINVSGAATFSSSTNMWLGVQIWDYAGKTSVSLSSAANDNYLSGLITGNVSQTSSTIQNMLAPLGQGSNQFLATAYDSSGTSTGAARVGSTDSTHTGVFQVMDPAGNVKYSIGDDATSATGVSESLYNGATIKTLWGGQYCVNGNPNGFSCLVPGDATHTGYLQFMNAAGAQQSYMGYDASGITSIHALNSNVPTIFPGPTASLDFAVKGTDQSTNDFAVAPGGNGTFHGTVTATSATITGQAASSGHFCLQIDTTGAITNTGSACGAGGGGVTSVGMTVPSWLSVAGSPVTSSGTLAVSANSQTANTFLAAPNGSSGAPSFRAIVAGDVPTLNQSTTGNAATATTLSTTGTNGQFWGVSAGVQGWYTPSGAGNVSTDGSATSGQIAQFNSSTSIVGVGTTGSGNVVLASSPTLTTGLTISGCAAGTYAKADGSGCATPTGTLPSASSNQQFVVVNTSGVGAAATTANTLINVVYNYGIDNTGTTDVSSSLAAIITGLPSTTPPQIYLPSGSYLINSGLNIPCTSSTCNAIRIVGAGRDNTILKTNCSGNVFGMWLNNTTNSGDNWLGPRIENLTIDDTSGTGACQSLLRLTQIAAFEVKNVKLENAKGKQYVAGTVTVTNGSTTVTGTGTSFTSAMVPGILYVGGYPQEICTFVNSNSLTLCSKWQQSTQSGVSYSLDYYGFGLMIEGGFSYSQYGTMSDIFAYGDLIGVYSVSEPTSGGTSRYELTGRAGWIDGLRINDSIGVWLGRFADTWDIAIPINETARGVVIESGHANKFSGEFEENGANTVVNTCNGGVASKTCIIGVEINADSSGTGYGNELNGSYIYNAGTAIRVDSSNVNQTEIVGLRTDGGNTTNYNFMGTTGCPASGSGVSAVILTHDCSYSINGFANGGSSVTPIQLNIPAWTASANTCYYNNAGTMTAADATHYSTASMTGLTSSMAPHASFAGNPIFTVGWGQTGGMTLNLWPDSGGNQLDWIVCNVTASSISVNSTTVNVGAP